MGYEIVGVMLIGIMLLYVGVRLNMDSPVVNLIRLALVVIGLIVTAIGIYGMSSLVPSM